MLTINQLVDNLLETALPLVIILLSSRPNKKEKTDLNEQLAQIHYEKDRLWEYEVRVSCNLPGVR